LTRSSAANVTPAVTAIASVAIVQKAHRKGQREQRNAVTQDDIDDGGQIALHRDDVGDHTVGVQGFQAVENHGAHEQILH